MGKENQEKTTIVVEKEPASPKPSKNQRKKQAQRGRKVNVTGTDAGNVRWGAGSAGRKGASRSKSRGRSASRSQKRSVKRSTSRRPKVTEMSTDQSNTLAREVCAIPKNAFVFTVDTSAAGNRELNPWVSVTATGGPTNVWNTIVWWMIKKIQAKSILFFSDSIAEDTQSVATTMWALRLLILDYFRRVGCIAANFVSAAGGFALPEFGDECPVPVCLAYLLHQCAPYSKDGFTMKFNFLGAGSFPTVDATDASAHSAKTDFSYSLNPIYNTAVNSAAGDLTVNAGTAATIAQIVQYAPSILGRLKQFFQTVPLGKIAKTAPDASAYTNVRLIGGLPHVITCMTKHFDDEMAVAMGFSANTLTSNFVGAKRSVPEWSMVQCTRSTFQITSFSRVPMLVSAVEQGCYVQYRPQPLKKALWYSDLGKISRIFIDLVDMDTALWHSYVGNLLCLIFKAMGVGASGPTNLNNVFALGTAAEGILLARLRNWAPWICPTGALASASEQFSGCEVTPSMKNYLLGLGPVVRAGQLTLVLPEVGPGNYLLNAQSNTFGDFTQTDRPYYRFFGTSSVASGANWNFQILLPSGNYAWSAANFPSTANYGLTPHYTAAKALCKIWDETLRYASKIVNSSTPPTAAIGSTWTPVLVTQDNNTILGRATNLVTFDATMIASLVADLTSGSFTAYDVQVSGVGAVGLITKAELENSLVSITRIFNLADRQNIPFTTQLDAIFPVASMVNADVSSEMSEAAKFRAAETGGFVSVAGLPLDTTASNPISEAMQPLYAAAIQGILPPSVELGKVLVKDLPAYADNQFAQLFPNIEPGSMLARNLEEVFARANRNPKQKMTFGRALREGVGAITRTTGEVLGAVVGQGIRGIALGLGAGGGAMVGKV